MMLVNLRDILSVADKYKYAQGAFNINSVTQIKAAIEIHEELRSPALLQGANLANGFMGGRIDFQNCTIEEKRIGAKNIGDVVRRYADKTDIPIVLHLDHGNDFEACVAAIDGGYTSVMIDGSHLPYDENVELTREVVKYAHARGVSVEGELGILAGVEDDVFSETSTYTHPMQAIDFFKKTEVDALAISYGTMHGPNKGKNAKIRKEIPIAIKECMLHEKIDGFLVSHGSSTVPQYIVEEINHLGGNITDASGISVSQLIEASKNGINKINVDTDIRLATTRNVRELLQKMPCLKNNGIIKQIDDILQSNLSVSDPRLYLYPIMDTLMYGNIPSEEVQMIIRAVELAVKEVVGTLIIQFGSFGKATLVQQRTLDEMAEYYKNRV
ncbi:class II fructose-bisphosphate aldolase [Tuanshanicoccus lijuaniae]|nr:class II fructose-bisphosphate aldolase [Aerococcaceae bacterium zg-1292]MBF6978200.1 class II fructose-bisphosphate aldolase [Aerococcaceae bacterium zg-BR22]MBS4456418.1 class II fructose-bisphosphate aldolase [Aerococcaceae bacterium zg-A91]MBS4458268.1 class II fructose-bisphosphate aldolase [Aerococcaceae bacterium zg-BR33]QQA38127.1 class II fructose-bisphosphate aldolase [Aerococcaceae bacterium zg-1292]